MVQDVEVAAKSSPLSIAVAIPTYGREKELINTITYILGQKADVTEILVLDQSDGHAPSVEMALSGWDAQGTVRWIKLTEPSIPAAMNRALMEARADVVAFLDDDIVPQDNLISAHLTAHRETDAAVVAGRIIQPWQIGVDFSDEETFQFASVHPSWIDRFMGGNFSVRREVAVRIRWI